MGEMIQLQIGGFGNRIGQSFWHTVTQEHGIRLDGTFCPSQTQKIQDNKLQRISSYFSEDRQGHYLPRAILADLQPSAIENILASPMANLYQLQNCNYLNTTSQNNYAKGYKLGKVLLDETLQAIRMAVQQCDHLQGFQFCYSTCGGTGSGFSSLLASHLLQLYPSNIFFSLCLTPQPQQSQNSLQIYNSIFSLGHEKSFEIPCILIDNGGLQRICQKKKKIEHSTFSDLNSVVSHAMSDITSTQRFSGEMNASFRKILNSIMPFKSTKFFTVTQGPLEKKNPYRPQAKIKNMLFQDYRGWSNQLHMFATNTLEQTLISSFFVFRGQHKIWQAEKSLTIPYKIDTQRYYYHSKRAIYSMKKVKWLSNHCTLCSVRQPNLQEKKSIVSLDNKSSIIIKLQELKQKYWKQYHRKAFLHWFLSEGMEELEMEESYNLIRDTITDYQSTTTYNGCCGEEQQYLQEQEEQEEEQEEEDQEEQ